MPSIWKTVRVFISSTFRDMHAERDHLVKAVFPALRQRLLPYRVELLDIDLRWGITEEEARSEKVIGLCLDQVEQCRPFFLAFLGQRYGWVPERIPADTQERFPFVQDFPGCSVTELEILYGTVLDAAGKRALFCLRDDTAVESIPQATRLRDFVENDPGLQRRLAELKAQLRCTSFPVQPYPAVWDGTIYDRVTRSRGKLAGLERFGDTVREWLWQAIRQELQLPDEPAAIDPLDAESDLHERFLETRLRVYVGRDALYQRLRAFALGDDEVPCLVTGESGLGKSAALARFVRDFRKEKPAVFVLPHFVGSSPRTTSLPAMLRRLCQELKRVFRLTLAIPDSPDEILGAFNVVLASIPESRRVVLVLDALNQLDADARAESLSWLPESLPANVKVLCSCVTGPQRAPKLLSAFGERAFFDVPLQALTEDERRDIIRAVPKLVAKTLDAKHIAALLGNPATHNPLFLMVALEELRGHGSFENLGKRIAELPRDGDALTRLFEKVFERLEHEFGRELVAQVLGLVACARRGVSGPELEALTAGLGQPAGELYPLLRQLDPYLHRREGRYDFYHTSIRRAVELHYLHWDQEEDQYDPFLRWQARDASDPTDSERRLRDVLVDHFDRDRLSLRAVEELPWQLAQLRHWQALHDLLADLPFFNAAWNANEFVVRAFWSMLQNLARFPLIQAYRPAIDNPAGHDPVHLWKLALFLQTCGHPPEAVILWEHLTQHYRLQKDDRRIGDCLGNQAVILRNQGYLEHAIKLLREAEVIYRRFNEPAGLARSLGNQAVILKDWGDLPGAMKLHKEEEVICRRFNDPAGLSRSLGNQALILKAQGDLPGAMKLHKEQEAICRRLNDPAELQRSLGNQALILKDQGDPEGAMNLHKEEEAICRRLNDPAGLAASLGNQAVILYVQGDLEGAMKLHKEEEAICRRLNDPSGLAISLVNQGSLQAFELSRPAEGLALAEEALRIATKHGLVALARQIGPILERIRALLG